ncbi:hypothetical protein QYE92_24235, partial [Enterobacter cloacae subsp. cloacae]|nr:hypothetical protein [Enterobacter cloacae subsp. cloacae]
MNRISIFGPDETNIKEISYQLSLHLTIPINISTPPMQDGVITEVLAQGQAPAQPCAQVFDAREHVVLPGLINTHHHFYQTLTRAWGPVVNQPLFPWLKTLYPVWARLTPEKLALASKVALAELLLS